MKTQKLKPNISGPRKKKAAPTVKAKKKGVQQKKRKYLSYKLVGAGTFGSVFRAKTPAGKVVAIKKVLQDPHYKNRELTMM